MQKEKKKSQNLKKFYIQQQTAIAIYHTNFINTSKSK